MAVTKYKPKAMPHTLEESVQANFGRADKSMNTAKNAVERSKRLIEQLHRTMEAVNRVRESITKSFGRK